MRTWGSKVAVAVAFLSLIGGGASGCSHDEEKEVPRFVPPGVGEPEGLIVTPRTLPPVGAGGTITLKGGGEIHTIMIDGKRYVPIESTFSETSWQTIIGQSTLTTGADKAKRDAAVKTEIDQVLAKISKHARVVGIDAIPSVGWASAFVPLDQYESLAAIGGIGRRVLVNPVVSTPIDRARRNITKDKEAGFSTTITQAGTGAFSNLEDLVGLSRMGIDEFVQQVQADVHGYIPDGSHVTIGITDTGITYNHPAFRDQLAKSRIDSMKDFTGEGRIFFTAAGTGRFEITPAVAVPLVGAQNEALTLTADFLVSPNDVYDSPDPSKMEAIEAKTILVPPDLKALLLAPNASGARFGVLSEPAFGTKAGDKVDLDHNGATDDRFYAILIPGSNGAADAVWVALGGVKGDFRKSPKLTSFDLAKETFTAYSEKIGLDIKHETILDGNGADVPVTTAAVVGFDPGNHGSHVAGIAAARKMIQNAPDNTKLHGVAPLARLASGRVCANTGGCRATKAITELSNAGAHVINMSIGSLGPENDGYGVQEAIIDRLTVQNGTVFVIAASNDGPGRQTVGSPSVSRFGISVAATASPGIIQAQYHWPGSGKPSTGSPTSPSAPLDDYLLYFSSRGPTSAGGMKPDISAPGTWLSAIQLNNAPGSGSGLDVMWGTSMASPAMAGAVALLLDAAKVYNIWNPDFPLAIDGRTIRRVVLGSARPFDVTSFDTKTLEAKKGQYTWVDEGFGMVNLKTAWELLKKERGMRQPAAVGYAGPGGNYEVPLDYQVRVLRVNPNGIAYDGTKSVEGTGDLPEPKLGRGLWLDSKDQQSLFRVQVARRLPTDVMTRPDIGDLALQLKTTADEFELETTIHGSHVQWVRAGVQNGVDCATTPIATAATLPHMLVVGEGATDVPVDPATGAGGSIAQTTSVMHVCVDRSLVDLLPPGDHGAIVSAYRVIGTAREAVPAFTVPVYITVPHKTLAGPAGLHISSAVESFGVARHYVDVPKGTTIVRLTLQVPEATVNGTAVTGCSGVELQALEGGNTATPPELVKVPSDAYVQNCGSTGKVAPTPDWRKLVITRAAPTAGIWDLHIFGLYAFKSSPYTLDVEFAKVTSTKELLTGVGATDLNAATFDVAVVDASYPLTLSAAKSTFTVTGFAADKNDKVPEGTKLRVAADAAGTLGRSYPADIASVTISTSKSKDNDLDLEILECDDAQLLTCKSAGTSAGPKDDESVTFTPKAGKLYVAVVEGYKIKANEGAFTLREELGSTKPEKGTLTIATSANGKTFSFTTGFDAATSLILADARYTSGTYSAVGAIDVKDDAGTLILRIPVNVHIP